MGEWGLITDLKSCYIPHKYSESLLTKLDSLILNLFCVCFFFTK